MARAKGSSKRSGSARKRGRDRLLLYFLLIVIAGLLGVIIAILPDSPEDQPPVVAEEASRPDPGSPDGSDASAGEAAGESAQSSPEAREAVEEPRPDGVTERYPEGEVAPSSGESPASDTELWWLPDPEKFGEVQGTLYLILDDAGNNLGPLPEFLEFPGPMAVAVLPQLPYSVEAAARTAAAGKEIMLHLPMQAVGGANPGPGALDVDMSDRDILRAIDDNLGSVPGVIGVNNHMGSRATADERVMEIVLADLTRRGLFFVDSRTSAESVSREVAGYLRTSFAERHVFLDNDRSPDAILAAIRGALELAHQQGSVVMIGHATVPELASVLNEIYPVLLDHGYQFGFVSDVVLGEGE